METFAIIFFAVAIAVNFTLFVAWVYIGLMFGWEFAFTVLDLICEEVKAMEEA